MSNKKEETEVKAFKKQFEAMNFQL